MGKPVRCTHNSPAIAGGVIRLFNQGYFAPTRTSSDARVGNTREKPTMSEPILSDEYYARWFLNSAPSTGAYWWLWYYKYSANFFSCCSGDKYLVLWYASTFCSTFDSLSQLGQYTLDIVKWVIFFQIILSLSYQHLVHFRCITRSLGVLFLAIVSV